MHSPTDRCTKSLGVCDFCGKGHAALHNGHFYACPDCGKTWRDLAYAPTPREAGYWRFLRAERAAGRLTDG